MTGSGNDFVFFDGRSVEKEHLVLPEVISAICNRHNGIGADGVVVLEQTNDGVRINYYNSDGSAADLCGNATLCSTTLSIAIGMAGEGNSAALETPAGTISGRIVNGAPEIDIGIVELSEFEQTPTSPTIAVSTGELRVGFVRAGIPHLVVLSEDVAGIDVQGRGAELRWHRATGPAGSNVNWVSQMKDGSGRFSYRTFERGVEGETLACGTGAVATAAQLLAWELAKSPVVIRSSSGLDLTVALEDSGSPGKWRAKLSGEGRVVYSGTIGDLPIR